MVKEWAVLEGQERINTKQNRRRTRTKPNKANGQRAPTSTPDGQNTHTKPQKQTNKTGENEPKTDGRNAEGLRPVLIETVS